MKSFFVCATLFLACATASTVTPVQKVITMLGGMLEKSKKEKHDEQVQFAAFKQWCDDTSTEKKRAIEEASQRIEQNKANIQQLTSDMATLSTEMAELDQSISTWTGDMKAATKVREIERADYRATHTDLSESIDALGRAIDVLKKQAYDRKEAGADGAASLTQVKQLSLIPEDAKRAIDTFLQDYNANSGLAVAAPEAPQASGYEFQSHGIIDMLEKLLDKFENQRTTAEKEEASSKHAYEMLMQDLNSLTRQAESDHSEKTSFRATAAQKRADTESDMQETQASKEEDSKYLSEMTGTCNQKASDFESRQELRADEITAVEKAMEILSSAAVSGNADKHLPALLQGSALAQLRSEGKTAEQQERAAKFLMDQSRQLNSRVLSTTATKVMQDPFAKVKKMIKDLLVRLMEEANDEAEHKGWCDAELSTNEQTRKEKTEGVEMLHAEHDQLTASISKLNKDLGELAKMIADLDSSMAKATEIRQQEKEENTATIADARDAQKAVAQAISVLKEFYAKAAEATSFVQQPEIFDSPYKGMQAENGGVVGMLEVIESDFARLEAETSASETSAAKQYDAFMSEAKLDKANKSTDVEHKTAEKQDQEQALTLKKEDLLGTQKELNAALLYFEKLKPSCVDAGVSYDDRVARRKEEIESLQEALRILNGEDIAVPAL